MRRSTILLSLALAVTPLSAQAPAGNGERPNVVLIITDDVGYGDFGSYGAPDIKTPNIDSLARDGVRLTDFYANGATCSPTRTGLISGRYQQRVALGAAARRRKFRGWGAGTACHRAVAATAARRTTATPRRSSASGTWDTRRSSAPAPTASTTSLASRAVSPTTTSTPPAKASLTLFENDRAVEVPGYMTDLITERSVRFIEQNAARPFFIDVAYNAAHWPYQPPDHPSVGPRQRQAPRAIRQFDEHARRLRGDARARRSGRRPDPRGPRQRGLRQNTIVIFTNDNGGEWLSRNTPLFHHKGTVWEGGIRVPAILRWPGRIPRGQSLGPGGDHDGPDSLDSRRDTDAGPGRGAPRRDRPAARARRARAGDRADAVLACDRRLARNGPCAPATGSCSSTAEAAALQCAHGSWRAQQSDRPTLRHRPTARAAARGVADRTSMPRRNVPRPDSSARGGPAGAGRVAPAGRPAGAAAGFCGSNPTRFSIVSSAGLSTAFT